VSAFSLAPLHGEGVLLLIRQISQMRHQRWFSEAIGFALEAVPEDV
jgi:hypothetical protein